MDVTQKIYIKLDKILNRLKSLKVIQSFDLQINFNEIEESMKASLKEIDSTLKKCLKKILSKPRKAEIRNVITELVRKKNLNKDSNLYESKFQNSLNKNFFNNEKRCKRNLLQSKIKKNYYTGKKCDSSFNTINYANKSRVQKSEYFSDPLKSDCYEGRATQSRSLKNDAFKECVMQVSSNKDVLNYEVQTETSQISQSSYRNVSKSLNSRIKLDRGLKNLQHQTSTKHKSNCHKTNNLKQKINYSGPFTCFCGKVFKLRKSMKKHESVKHSLNANKFHCNVCKKSFHEKGKLNRHMLSHTSSKHQCPQCFRQFARSDALKRHLNSTHFQKKEYTCSFCDKKFSFKFNKDTHEKNVHGNLDSPLLCKQCGQECKNKMTLKSHMKLHGDKIVKCSLCNKTFSRKTYYKSHMKNKHTRVSEFQTLLDSITNEEIDT